MNNYETMSPVRGKCQGVIFNQLEWRRPYLVLYVHTGSARLSSDVKLFPIVIFFVFKCHLVLES